MADFSTISGNVSDLSANFIPQVWLDWVDERVTQTNNFFQSGVIAPCPVGDQLLQRGLFLTIPHIQYVDTSLPTQKWDNKNDIQTHSLTSFDEQDVKLYEVQSFGNSDYDDLITGANTLDDITSQFVDYWSSINTQRLIQVLNATYLNTDVATAKSFGVGNEKDFAATDFTKAMARMGDVGNEQVTTIAMNSGTYNFLVNQNLITFLQPSEGATPIASYNGLRIIKDDRIPLNADGTTSAYIFGNGAVYYSQATPTNGLTLDRDNLKQGGINAVTQKRVFMMHVAGTAPDMTVEADPNNWKADLEAGGKALYKEVNDVRNIKIIKYGFKIDPDFVIYNVNSWDKPKAPTTGGGTSK